MINFDTHNIYDLINMKINARWHIKLNFQRFNPSPQLSEFVLFPFFHKDKHDNKGIENWG